MQEKLTIINSKRVGERNTLLTKKCSEWSVRCYTLLDPFLWISDVLGNMFVSGLCGLASLPFHPQWSRSLQYAYASVCRSHAVGRCCMFSKSVLITFPRFPCCSLSSKILPVAYSPKTVFFEPVQVLNRSLVSTAKWDITLPVYL